MMEKLFQGPPTLILAFYNVGVVDRFDVESLERRRMKYRKAEAYFRRLAAVHKAGHIVIGAFVGAELSSAWVVRETTAPDNERRWKGHVQFGNLEKLPPADRRAVGIAGLIAEHCWLWRRDESFFIDDFELDFDDPDCMSQSDWDMMGCEPGQPDDECFQAEERVSALLTRGGELWPALVHEARRLIIEARPRRWH